MKWLNELFKLGVGTYIFLNSKGGGPNSQKYDTWGEGNTSSQGFGFLGEIPKGRSKIKGSQTPLRINSILHLRSSRDHV